MSPSAGGDGDAAEGTAASVADGDATATAAEAADPPTVALVVYGDLDTRSGGFLYDRKLADHLADHGWRVDVVSLPERPYRRSFATNLSPGLVGRLRAADVVVEDAYCHPALLLANRRLTDTPVVTIVHYLRSKERRVPWRDRVVRAVEADYLDTVDGYVFNSCATRNSVAELVEASVADLRGTVAPPAGDRLGVGEGLSNDRLHRDPFRVVSVCNVTPRKGVTTLVEGLSRIDAEWELHVVGDTAAAPGYVDEVRELAARRGVADDVTLLGRVHDDRLREELREAHVLAVPSRYEPFGIVYLEGMAYGLPAVASAHGGADDVVDADNGALVPPNDPAAVTDAVAPLVSDRERLRRKSRAARETFRAHPTWAETCARIRRFLEGFR